MVLRLHASYTPRAWIPRDLGFHISLVFNCYLNEILGPTLRGLPLHPDGRCPIFSLYGRGPISISNIGLRIATSKTDQLPGMCLGPTSRGSLPLPSIGVRCLRSASESMTEDWSGHLE